LAIDELKFLKSVIIKRFKLFEMPAANFY